MRYLESWEDKTDNNFICNYEDCGFVCENKIGLVNHRMKIHIKSSQKIKCESCNEIFDYKSNITTHTKSCTGIYLEDNSRKIVTKTRL